MLNIKYMKRYIFFIVFIGCFFLSGCNSYEYDLQRMGEAVQKHFRYRDAENGTKTTINYLKALTYEEIPEAQRKQPEEYYLCKVHIQGTWVYDNSYRIFNMDDTLDCFFSKSKVFLRMEDSKQK